eukprot:12469913-Alexandrium_andersonii.AAC.1
MCRLTDAGWTCEVLVPKRERLAGALEPSTFLHGSDTSVRAWWIRKGAASVFQEYLLALLLAGQGELTQAVDHFKPKKWYKALLEGQPLPEPRRRFQVSRASGDAALQPRPAKRRR